MKYGDDLRFSMSLKLWRNEKAFGPGIARLLELVEEYESLNKAASIMGMAYSKVWKILNNSEKALGFPLIERRIGGVGGGSRVEIWSKDKWEAMNSDADMDEITGAMEGLGLTI